MRSGVVSVIVCAAGCAKIEDAFEDPGTPVSVLDEGPGRRVIGPNYTMVFHAGPVVPEGAVGEVHMPESLQFTPPGVDSATAPNRLSDGGSEPHFERMIGFGVFPALIATHDTDGVVTLSDITTNDDGPFVGQVSVNFKIDYTCDDPIGTQTFSATSIFTFFPNGKINRFDTKVQALAGGPLTPGGIGCGSNPFQFPATPIVTSFWAFDESAETETIENGSDVPASGLANVVAGGCTTFADGAIGLQYLPRTSRLAPNSNADAYVHDFITSGTTLTSTEFDVQSQALMVSRTDRQCGAILAELARPAIQVGDEEVPAPNQDGIYQDPFNPRDQPYTVQVIGNTAVPAGWVLATEPTSDTIRITRDDGTEPSYNVQRLEVGLTRMLIIFNEPLERGQTITIEPL